MVQPPSGLCPDNSIASLTATLRSDERKGSRDLEKLLQTYPDDPRLHFLSGSLFAAHQDYVAARRSMRHAVDLAPDFNVARFQLGFLLLTCGEPHAAQEAWGPLHGLSGDSYLLLFVKGLCHLIKDEFDDARRLLREGISRNQEIAEMNRDMQMIIDELNSKADPEGGARTLSSVDMLLQQAAMKSVKH